MHQSTIQIEIQSTPDTGRHYVFDHGPITFGRAVTNMLTIDHVHTSRQHGEIQFADGHWQLIITGRNTTTVNGRKLRGRAHRLKDQDLVAVGSQPLFQVNLLATTGAATKPKFDGEPVPEAVSHQHLTRRGRLWIGIGLYLIFMIGLIVFLFTLKSGDDNLVHTVPRLTGNEITRSIRQPLPSKKTYAAQMQHWLDQARTLYDRLGAMPDMLFDTYHAFQMAVAYAPSNRLVEGADLLNFEHTRKQLIKTITVQYDNAYRKLKSHQYEEAYAAFEQVMQSYPATSSLIYRNMRQHQNIASEKMEQSAYKRRRGLF